MKVTAIIDDKLIQEAIRYSKSATITDALKIALKAYINSQKLKELSQQVKNNPLVFNCSAEDLRSINRKR
ncbi:type II toxin-antitoxin system VapB family antitoxin [Pedobacter immunditicola]|uniref:type II toxin-antitoxin system VapB family antitoxin n=1 Tax=Pedobacter immunditicola TaxID=3133440 RepID=UPI0030958735